MASWLNGNKYFNDTALLQNIPIGSKEWIAGGLLPYSGSSGDHPAYGWNHTNKILELGLNWVKAVYSNYGARRSYYGNAPVRLISYEAGGRPQGYFMQQPGDMPDGQTAYLTETGTVLVSGPDILHFHLGPLFALYDKYPGDVETSNGVVKGRAVAGMMIRFLMKSLAGMVTKTPGNVTTTTFGDRGSANIVNAVTQATKRGVIDPEDLDTLFHYITKTTIPFFEKAPGLTLNQKPEYIDGMKNIQIYNGLYWLLPIFHWAFEIAPGELKLRLQAIVKRWSKYMEDLEVLAPGKGAQVAWIQTPDAILKGIPGTNFPVKSWAGILQPQNVRFGTTDWSLWGMTAQYVGAKVLNSEILTNASIKNFEKWKPKRNPQNKVWMVDAEGDYL